jgi:predicted ester cyclase
MHARMSIARVPLRGCDSRLSGPQNPRAVEVVRSMSAVINNERDSDDLDYVVAEHVQRPSAATPGVEVRSLDELRQYLRNDLASVPDARQRVDLIFGTGSMVGVRATYTGTPTGRMGPSWPSGRSFELPFIGARRVGDGKIAQMRVEWDNLCALTQLGLQPPAGSMEPRREQ